MRRGDVGCWTSAAPARRDSPKQATRRKNPKSRRRRRRVNRSPHQCTPASVAEWYAQRRGVTYAGTGELIERNVHSSFLAVELARCLVSQLSEANRLDTGHNAWA